MTIYISQGRYTAAAIKGMSAKPEDRSEAVAELFAAAGARLISWYLTLGPYDWLIIAEAPDEPTMISVDRRLVLRSAFRSVHSSFREVFLSYAKLMVHLELGQSNTERLRVVADIARRFQAEVVGIAACRPMEMVLSESYVPAEIIDQDRERIEKDIQAAETEFRSDLQGRVTKVEWRSEVTFSSLSDYIAREARSADLVITGVTPGRFLDSSRRVNLGDLIMQLGRPVLIVPAASDVLKLERVVVGWKDTRETRRAVSDALPLLKAAAQVTVVEIAGECELAAARSHVGDVVDWLKRHGVVAKALASASTGDDATQLNAIAHERGAHFIVAGAYGHSRLREWALGGVTRDLLRRVDRCSLLSH